MLKCGEEWPVFEAVFDDLEILFNPSIVNVLFESRLNSLVELQCRIIVVLRKYYKSRVYHVKPSTQGLKIDAKSNFRCCVL